MNLLLLSFDYPPTPGGISAHVRELAKACGRAWLATAAGGAE